MDTRAILGFTVAIAIGAMMWQMGGFSHVLGVDGPGDNLQSPDRFEDQANDSAVRSGVNGSVRANNDNLVGLALAGIGAVVDGVAFVGLLPWELEKLGVPWYGAYPLGIGGWYGMGWGLWQFAAGRIWR